jgi:hypothetical protein
MDAGINKKADGTVGHFKVLEKKCKVMSHILSMFKSKNDLFNALNKRSTRGLIESMIGLGSPNS